MNSTKPIKFEICNKESNFEFLLYVGRGITKSISITSKAKIELQEVNMPHMKFKSENTPSQTKYFDTFDDLLEYIQKYGETNLDDYRKLVNQKIRANKEEIAKVAEYMKDPKIEFTGELDYIHDSEILNVAEKEMMPDDYIGHLAISLVKGKLANNAEFIANIKKLEKLSAKQFFKITIEAIP